MLDIFRADQYAFNPHSLPLLGTAIALTAVLAQLFTPHLATRIRTLLVIAVSAATMWLLAFSCMYSSRSAMTALKWARIAYLAVPFLGVATYELALQVRGNHKVYKPFTLSAWLIAAIFAGLAFDSEFLVTVRERSWGFYPAYGYTGVLFLAYFLLTATSAAWHLYRAYEEAKYTTSHRMVQFLGLGIVVGYLAGVDFIPKLGAGLYPAGYVCILASAMLVSRGVQESTIAVRDVPTRRSFSSMESSNRTSSNRCRRTNGLTSFSSPVRHERTQSVSVTRLDEGRMGSDAELGHWRYALIAHEDRVRQEERKRLGLALNDTVGQVLGLAKLQVVRLKERAGSVRDPVHRMSLQRIVDAFLPEVASAHRIVQRLSLDLQTRDASEERLADTLERESMQFAQRSGIHCVRRFEPIQLQKESTRLTVLVFREILTNIARHARATSVEVTLQQRSGLVVLSVHDNGKGITVGERTNALSFGLQGMHARARALHGEIVIEGHPQQGTTVILSFPSEPTTPP